MSDRQSPFDDLMRDGRFEEALTLAREETEQARQQGKPEAEALGHVRQAYALWMMDLNEEALAQAERAEAAVAGMSTPDALQRKSDALRMQAQALRMMGRSEEALATAQRGSAIARAIGYAIGEANALQPEIYLLLNADRNDEALAAAQHAADVSRSAGYVLGEAIALDTLSDIVLKLGAKEEALKKAEQAATLFHQLHDPLREANALQSQANALLELDRAEESFERATTAERLYTKVGDRLGQGNVLRAQADALRKLGRYEEALACAQASEARHREIGSRLGPGFALRAQAEILSKLGRYAEAVEQAECAYELFREADYRQGQAEALLAKYLATVELGREEDAIAAAQKAQELFQESGMPVMADYAGFLVRSLSEPPATEPGAKAVARLHAEFGTQLGEILTSADRAEEAWHTELRKPRRDPCPPGTGEFLVLKQWPSYATLSLLPYPDEVAGGYFLRWGNQNLVIDPGLGFLLALRHAGLHLSDIDAVVVTHWHIDHTGDMEELLTSLFEANDDGMVAEVDFFLPPGAFGVYASLVAHNPAARSVTLLRPGETALWRGMHLTAVAAGHRDLTGREGDAIGLRVELMDEGGAVRGSVGLTSDTRWDPGLVEPYRDVDLLIMHLGGIYSRDLKPAEYAKNHLGVKGTAALLSALADAGRPRLTLLSEIGKELEYERVALTAILAEVTGCAVVPAELGMCISLPALTARCDGHACEREATRWGMDPADRKRICVRCDECTAPLLGAVPFPRG